MIWAVVADAIVWLLVFTVGGTAIDSFKNWAFPPPAASVQAVELEALESKSLPYIEGAISKDPKAGKGLFKSLVGNTKLPKLQTLMLGAMIIGQLDGVCWFFGICPSAMNTAVQQAGNRFRSAVIRLDQLVKKQDWAEAGVVYRAMKVDLNDIQLNLENAPDKYFELLDWQKQDHLDAVILMQTQLDSFVNEYPSLAVAMPPLPEILHFDVLSVYDGDTFRTTAGVWIRLLGIDAPEAGTISGAKAGDYLRALIDGKRVEVRSDPFDQWDVFKRVLGVVYLEGVNINKKMAIDGYAKLVRPDRNKWVDYAEWYADVKEAIAENVFLPLAQLKNDYLASLDDAKNDYDFKHSASDLSFDAQIESFKSDADDQLDQAKDEYAAAKFQNSEFYSLQKSDLKTRYRNKEFTLIQYTLALTNIRFAYYSLRSNLSAQYRLQKQSITDPFSASRTDLKKQKTAAASVLKKEYTAGKSTIRKNYSRMVAVINGYIQPEQPIGDIGAKPPIPTTYKSEALDFVRAFLLQKGRDYMAANNAVEPKAALLDELVNYPYDYSTVLTDADVDSLANEVIAQLLTELPPAKTKADVLSELLALYISNAKRLVDLNNSVPAWQTIRPDYVNLGYDVFKYLTLEEITDLAHQANEAAQDYFNSLQVPFPPLPPSEAKLINELSKIRTTSGEVGIIRYRYPPLGENYIVEIEDGDPEAVVNFTQINQVIDRRPNRTTSSHGTARILSVAGNRTPPRGSTSSIYVTVTNDDSSGGNIATTVFRDWDGLSFQVGFDQIPFGQTVTYRYNFKVRPYSHTLTVSVWGSASRQSPQITNYPITGT